MSKKKNKKEIEFLKYQEHCYNSLNNFILNCMDSTERITSDKKLYKQYKSFIKANKRAIRFYCRLKKFCNKNKHIKGFVQDV